MRVVTGETQLIGSVCMDLSLFCDGIKADKATMLFWRKRRARTPLPDTLRY